MGVQCGRVSWWCLLWFIQVLGKGWCHAEPLLCCYSVLCSSAFWAELPLWVVDLYHVCSGPDGMLGLFCHEAALDGWFVWAHGLFLAPSLDGVGVQLLGWGHSDGDQPSSGLMGCSTAAEVWVVCFSSHWNEGKHLLIPAMVCSPGETLPGPESVKSRLYTLYGLCVWVCIQFCVFVLG